MGKREHLLYMLENQRLPAHTDGEKETQDQSSDKESKETLMRA